MTRSKDAEISAWLGQTIRDGQVGDRLPTVRALMRRFGTAQRTVERALRYVDAGADCVFVPGVNDEAVIRALADAIPAPLNIVAGLASPVIDAPALFLPGETYGTRCSTLVAVSRAGHVMMVERRYDAGGRTTGRTSLTYDWGV